MKQILDLLLKVKISEQYVLARYWLVSTPPHFSCVCQCVPNLRALQCIDQKFLRFEISTCEQCLLSFKDFIGNEAFFG